MKKLLALLFILALAGLAHADQVTLQGNPCGSLANNCGPFIFTITADNGSASISITNTSSATWFLQMFSLDLYSAPMTATFNGAGSSGISGGTSFALYSGNGNNGQNICNQGGSASAFCVQVNAGGDIAAGATAVYAFTIANGNLTQPSDLWHIQAALFTGNGKGANQVALSTGPGGTTVPEPASLALLGSGLVGAGGFLRRTIVR